MKHPLNDPEQSIYGFAKPKPTPQENLASYHTVLASRRLTVILILCLTVEVAVLVWWVTGH